MRYILKYHTYIDVLYNLNVLFLSLNQFDYSISLEKGLL